MYTNTCMFMYGAPVISRMLLQCLIIAGNYALAGIKAQKTAHVDMDFPQSGALKAINKYFSLL